MEKTEERTWELREIRAAVPHDTGHGIEVRLDVHSRGILAQYMDAKGSGHRRDYTRRQVELIWCWCWLREIGIVGRGVGGRTVDGDGNISLGQKILAEVAENGWPRLPWVIDHANSLVVTWITGRPQELTDFLEGE